MDRPVPNRAMRSVAVSRGGMVATSQAAATLAGVEALRAGGNAVDAAIAAHAVMGVVEPHSSGIGGDAFALIWDPRERCVTALNGSGGAPAAASWQRLRAQGLERMPERGALTVTVPGAVRAFATLTERYGRRTLGENLAAAIAYAEDGFAVAEIAAAAWSASAPIVARHGGQDHPFGRPVRAGQVVRLPALARTLRAIAQDGAQAFYEGEIAAAMVRAVGAGGGLLSLGDLRQHRSQWVEPISTTYRGCQVFAPPPNGQGIAGLEMLNILEGFDLRALQLNGAPYLHVIVEAKRLAQRDLARHLADPDCADVPVTRMLDKSYAVELRALIDAKRTLELPVEQPARSGTVYAAAVDADGLCCSLISSVYVNFGSGIVDAASGVNFQNRGALFSLDPASPNALTPGQRPYHTIVPWLVLRAGAPWLTLGIVGGEMQPQGMVQILCALTDFELGLQEAVELARVRHSEGAIAMESGIAPEVRAALAELGHRIVPSFGPFSYGGAQAIALDGISGVRHGASDPRKDGIALGT
ncbi:gamma-glutamyltransferase family protein [bacterium]|nr:MAG: gamma-glutamyltransferase family protein [bacterium]